MANAGSGGGGVRAQPVAARFAGGIDALHGKTRQILHGISPFEIAIVLKDSIAMKNDCTNGGIFYRTS